MKHFRSDEFCFSAPTAPPQNLSVFNISSTSLRVTWDPLPREHRRGTILGYKIFYQKFVNSLRVTRSIDSGEQSVDGSSLELDLMGLEKFTNYCITAWAFNSMGSGNKTETFCASTDEDGMKVAFSFLCCIVRTRPVQYVFK